MYDFYFDVTHQEFDTVEFIAESEHEIKKVLSAPYMAQLNIKFLKDGCSLILFPERGVEIWSNENGTRHRENGPAFIAADSPTATSFWLEGVKLSFDEWCQKAKCDDELKTFLKLKYS